ncbi:MAG: YfhO family protein, partial [Candidatus Omnitrophica bacterium]|nr:YfhO family protein [Candidatus Omnitrophota bacterium]
MTPVKPHNQMQSNSIYRNMLVIIIFTVLGMMAINPVICNFTGKVFGNPKDALVTVWHFWWLKIADQQEISDLKVPLVSAPYGADYSKYPYYPVWNFINKHLSAAIGEVRAYNIQILLGFILSGLAMYYLVFFFTKNIYASVLSGLIFTFSPYHFSHAFEHLGLSNMQWLVFYILGLFNFIKKPSYISAVLCGILFALTGFFDYYYLYFAGIFSSVFFLYYCFYYRVSLKEKIIANTPYILTGALMAAALLLPSLLHIVKFLVVKSSESPLIHADYGRPFGQLFADSARILNYILPAHFHPLLGWITRPFIDTFLYGDNPPEQTLYLGWTGLLLSYLWVTKWRRKKDALEKSRNDVVFSQSFFLFAFFAFMIFSFPPFLKLGKIFIPFPSFFLYKVFSMFRNYARMGVFVLISICVLAGFGTAYFLKNFSERKKTGLTVLIALLICFEFLPYPPQRVIDAGTVPPVYQWLAKQEGDCIVAEYPIDADERPYLFFQRYHKKRLVNGVIPGTRAEALRKKIIDVNAEKTAGILRFIGVQYLVL